MAEDIPVNETSLVDVFPYASRLTSNYVPNTQETREIEAFLVEPTRQLQEMEAAIFSLQLEEGRLVLLRTRHAALKKQVETCQSLITIPRRVPDDVMLEVFRHCLLTTSNPTMDTSTAPLLLTAVCRRWRNLALGYRTLWSALHIPITNHTQIDATLPRTSLKKLKYLLPVWLQRSGPVCPLTFSLVVPRRMNKNDEFMVSNCLNALVPFVSRWKSIFLSGHIQSLSAFFKIPASDLETLESLLLGLSFSGYSNFPAAAPMFNAPNLRKVSIKYGYLDLLGLALPWARLTHLDISAKEGAGISISHLSTTLNQCTSLIYLGLNIKACGQNVKTMHLPNLQRIYFSAPFGYPRPDTFTVFCEKLISPSLRQITMQDFDKRGFLAVLSSHGQSIQKLEVHTNFHISIDVFANGLRYCPSLRSLSIIGTCLPDSDSFKADRKFFAFFTGNNERNMLLCPLLQELMLDHINCKTLVGLVSFLEIKQNRDPHIFSPLLKFSTDGYIQENGHNLGKKMVTRTLKPFIDSGLLFEMWYGHRPGSYRGREDDRRDHRFQYADCWRD